MSDTKKKQGYKSDIQETCSASDVEGLGLVILQPKSISGKGTVWMQGGKGVTACGHRVTAQAKVFFSKSKNWDEADRNKFHASLGPLYLRDLLPDGAILNRDTSKPVEREQFSSAGGNLQLKGSYGITLHGRPARLDISMSFAGSRDWPEQRPEADAAETGDEAAAE